MILEDKLKKKSIESLYELKNIMNSLANDYAEKLTDYALISGDNNLQNLSSEQQFNYSQRKKYKDGANRINNMIIERVDKLLC